MHHLPDLVTAFNPTSTVATLRVLLLALVGVVLLAVVLLALWTGGRKGDVGKTARIVVCVCLALVPLGITAAVFGKDIAKWLGLG